MFGSIKSFKERAARVWSLEREPEEKRVWIVTRNCLCGHKRLMFGRFEDTLICYQCGIMHFVGWEIHDPIAKRITESQVTPEMTRL